MRIVSLLPSATDILVGLGARDDVVGVSHSCGDEWSNVPRLTSTWIDTDRTSSDIDAQVQQAIQPLYQLDLATLEALAPDVVVSQSLCEVCAIPAGDVEAAIQSLPSKPELVDLSPQRLDEVPLDFARVGEVIGRQREAQALFERWQSAFGACHLTWQAQALRVAFLDWIDPPFAAGHWVPDMIEWLGAQSALARPGEPSFQVDWTHIQAVQADVVIAACCGFAAQRVTDDCHKAPVDIVLLDGDRYFSRPSPVLIESIEILTKTLAHLLDD